MPHVGQGVDLGYTVGVRIREWTLEATRWGTGEPVFSHVLGPGCYNSLGAGIILDGDGRIVHGIAFGKLRIH